MFVDRETRLNADPRSIPSLVTSTPAFLVELYGRHPVAIGAGVFLAYMAVIMIVTIVKPQFDWDSLAYMAIAVERTITSPAALHAYVYDAIRNGLPAGDFILATRDGGYRSQMYADPAGFVSMLGMYRIKLLYGEALALLAKALPPLTAVRVLSQLSTLAFAAVTYMWLRYKGALGLAPVFVGVLIVTSFAFMARIGTPDMFFAALLTGAAYAYVRECERTTFALLMLAFLARPDNVIFLGVFAGLCLLLRQWSWSVLGAFALSAALTAPIAKFTGQPGWWTQLYFASIEHSNTLEGFHPAFSVTLYFYALAKQALLAVSEQSWVGAALLALAGIAATLNSGRRFETREGLLLAALLLGAAAKFVAAPVYDTRIYFVYVVLPFVILLGAWAPGRKKAA